MCMEMEFPFPRDSYENTNNKMGMGMGRVHVTAGMRKATFRVCQNSHRMRMLANKIL